MFFRQISTLVPSIWNTVRRTCGLLLIFAITASTTYANGGDPPPAPEMDPGSAVCALALVAAGFLLLTDRFVRGRRQLGLGINESAQMDSAAQ